MDRINGLSDEIICHILSFLATKESALTSLLSKRWRNLFTFTPNLHLDDGDDELGCAQSFIDFVDRVLAVSGNFPIRKISIKCRKSIGSGHVTRWMNEVLKRGVTHLVIDVIAHEEAFLVPLEMFTCDTIVELKLARGFEAMIPDDVSLPSLKTLFFHSFHFYNTRYCVLGKLLSACPVLEELTICGVMTWQSYTSHYCRTLSSTTLKKLTMKCIGQDHFWDMAFDTPSLVYLEYTDLVPREYPVVNLESLVEAKLDLSLYTGISNPTNLIKGLRNVQVLELSSDRTSKMFYEFREVIPVLSKLFHLSITTDLGHYYWKYFPILLEKSPSLHTLVIKGPLHAVKCERQYGLSCPVKVLKITKYGGKIEELKQMKHFLEKLSCLELVKVRACAINDMEKFQITKDLQMVFRSSKCNIQIKFCEKTK
ncbi:F-box protein [Cardamine amara subsp. amara]|uniref:F-box protein n=1 Tax=Cardamine amara subsp. amara TaxID=228776 RepID=A0ABD1AM59_CARAN